MSLRVTIVGAGICGISSAIALRRAGHRVTIYERYGGDADAGAGIVVMSNGTRVLKEWGIDLKAMGASTWKQGVVLDGQTLEERYRMIVDPSEQDEAVHMATRSDLRLLLLGEAQRRTEGQGSIEFVYDAHVVDYDAGQPAVMLEDGAWVRADLVVACDGIRSKAAQTILGELHPARPTGFSAFRLLIPHEDLQKVAHKFQHVGLVRDKFQKGGGQAWFATEYPGRNFVWWTCRFDTVHAMDVIIPDNEGYASSEEWLVRCEKEVLLQEFSHWHPIFTEILAVADKPHLWKICRRDPATTLHKEKLCMLGDALHPMPPFRAQGGTMSIEDSGVLGACFSNVSDPSQVTERLELLQKLRVPRYVTVQMLSAVRQDEANVQERYQEVLEECRKWLPEQDQSHLNDPKSIELWMQNYDAIQEATDMVNQVFAT